MPLGIELAAAWLRVLPCQEIAAEIESSLDMLSTAPGHFATRHGSLRAIFDSSWQMLAGEEREVLKALSIFRGGFGRVAAGRVAGAGLAGLSALLDKSWLHRRFDGRYEMHELLRQYCGEKLDDEPQDGVAVRDRHSRYYLTWLADLAADLKGRRQVEALREIREELRNVEAAWEWAVERRDWDRLGAAAESLWIFYFDVSAFAAGQRVFGRGAGCLAGAAATNRTANGEAKPQAARSLGKLLVRHGTFSLLVGQFGPARDRLQEGLAWSRQAGDQAETAFALNWLGNMATAQSNLPVAQTLYEESLGLRRALDDRWSTATSLYNFGSLMWQFGEYVEARRLCEESLALRRGLRDLVGLAFVLGDLGGIALRQGELAEAERFFVEGIAIRRELADDICVPFSYSRSDLSDVAYLMGNYAEAERLARESLARLRRADNQWNIPFALARLGLIRCALGDGQVARELLQEGLALAGTHLEPPATAQLLNNLGQVCAMAGDHAAAERCHRQSLTIARERGNRPEIAAALAGLGQAACNQATYEQARAFCGEALDMFETMGARLEAAALLRVLGDVARGQGHLEPARRQLLAAWQTAAQAGAAPLALAVLLGLAELKISGPEEGLSIVASPPSPAALRSIAELLALPLSEPRAAHWVRERAEALQARLADAMDPGELAAALERGSGRPLESLFALEDPALLYLPAVP